MKPRIFSGMQPTGSLHIGNYIGELKNWADIQFDSEPIFCIVDHHAITIPEDPKALQEKIEQVAALSVAAGIDPNHSAIFVQSQVPAHVELAWVFTCVTPFGWLGRMTQFKAKSEKQESVGTGLFDDPVLMAADILLYQANIVPVGCMPENMRGFMNEPRTGEIVILSGLFGGLQECKAAHVLTPC
jgi:tryptophanyl-tRNA synthetase